MPAQIVSVFNQKGGCGKTHTSMQLGGALGLRGKKVMVVALSPVIIFTEIPAL